MPIYKTTTFHLRRVKPSTKGRLFLLARRFRPAQSRPGLHHPATSHQNPRDRTTRGSLGGGQAAVGFFGGNVFTSKKKHLSIKNLKKNT